MWHRFSIEGFDHELSKVLIFLQSHSRAPFPFKESTGITIAFVLQEYWFDSAEPGKRRMGLERERSNRVRVTDWAEVVSYPAKIPLGVGHLNNISEGGLAIDLPVSIPAGTEVQIRLSTVGGGLLRHFQFIGSIVHSENWGQGGMHGIQFVQMIHAERRALMDYLREVEGHYRAAS